MIAAGSTEGTPELVRSSAAGLVLSEAGQDVQLNAGPQVASGDALLFEHADVLPPPDLGPQISSAVQAGRIDGNFRLSHPEG